MPPCTYVRTYVRTYVLYCSSKIDTTLPPLTDYVAGDSESKHLPDRTSLDDRIQVRTYLLDVHTLHINSSMCMMKYVRTYVHIL